MQIDNDKWTSLYPNIPAQYCLSCKSRVTYFIDRWDSYCGKIVLKSFERGHSIENDEAAKQAGLDLEIWMKNYLKS